MAAEIRRLSAEDVSDPRVRYLLGKRELIEKPGWLNRRLSFSFLTDIYASPEEAETISRTCLVNITSRERCCAMLPSGGVNYIINDYGFLETVAQSQSLRRLHEMNEFMMLDLQKAEAQGTWDDRFAELQGEMEPVNSVTGNLVNRDILVDLATPLIYEPEKREIFRKKVSWPTEDGARNSDTLVRGVLQMDETPSAVLPAPTLTLVAALNYAFTYIFGHELSHIIQGERDPYEFLEAEEQAELSDVLGTMSLYMMQISDRYVSTFGDLLSVLPEAADRRAISEARHDCYAAERMFRFMAASVPELSPRQITRFCEMIFEVASTTNMLIVYRRTVEEALRAGTLESSRYIEAMAEAAYRNAIVFAKLLTLAGEHISFDVKQLVKSQDIRDFSFEQQFKFLMVDMDSVAGDDWPGFIRELNQQ